MSGIKIYVQTGERFAREDDGNFPGSVGLSLASGESDNKVYQFPVGPGPVSDFAARKPLDAGSMKLLSNNISHLLYQKCRTLCCVSGPGTFGLLKAFGTPMDSFADTPIATGAEQFREINWSRPNSLRLGPFSGMVDRKTEDSPGLQSLVPANTQVMRKLLLVIKGFKREEGILRFHVCGTSNAGTLPSNPSASLFRIDAGQLAWIEMVGGGPVLSNTVPLTPYSNTVAFERQSWNAYTCDILPAYYGEFRLFIPIDFLHAVEDNNWSPTEMSSIFKFFVWLGWYSPDEEAGISSITLLEVRDIGTAEAS